MNGKRRKPLPYAASYALDRARMDTSDLIRELRIVINSNTPQSLAKIIDLAHRINSDLSEIETAARTGDSF